VTPPDFQPIPRAPAAAAPLVLPLPLPRLEGGGIVLRSLVAADADALATAAAELRLAQGPAFAPPPPPDGAGAAFVADALVARRDADIWAIDGTPSGDGPLLGIVSLKPLGRGQSQIGYWVAPACRNSGIASRAVRALVNANPHAARTLFAEVFQHNPVSARVLTQAGFDYIGDAEAVSVAHGGASVPTWTYLRRMG